MQFAYKVPSTLFKKFNFREYVKFGVISRKIDILSITVSLKFKSKILLHKYGTYNCDYLLHTIFYFYLIDFRLNTEISSQFCIFSVNHLTLLKDRFIKKIL